ncbi:MAG: hypothetical protein RL637_393 [Pseudomonadota bacterium]
MVLIPTFALSAYLLVRERQLKRYSFFKSKMNTVNYSVKSNENQKFDASILTKKPCQTTADLSENTNFLPQDSILKRHYIHHLLSMLYTVYGDCPSDSILRRHYETLIATQLKECSRNIQALLKLETEYRRIKHLNKLN